VKRAAALAGLVLALGVIALVLVRMEGTRGEPRRSASPDPRERRSDATAPPEELTRIEGSVRVEIPSPPDASSVSYAEAERGVLSGELAYCGRVIERESGAPVPGAVVQVRESFAHEPPELRQVPDRVHVVSLQTDEHGAFRLRLPARSTGAEWRLTIEAAGLGLVTGRVTNGHEIPERAQTFRLHPEATLVGVVTDVGGRALPGVELALSVGYHALDQPSPRASSASEPWLEGWRAWRTSSDADGRFRISGLAPRARLRLQARTADLLPMEHELTLAPGEERALELVLSGPVTVLGLVVDQDGASVGGLELWVERALDGRSRSFTGDSQPFAAVRTDAEGQFIARHASPGLWRIGPAPDDPHGFAAHGKLHEIGVQPTQEVRVSVQRGLTIEGRVEDETGAAIERVRVGIRSSLGELSGHVVTPADGLFRLGPLIAGEYVVAAQRGSFVSDAVLVRAGTKDVRLRLPRSEGAIRGRAFMEDEWAEGALVLAIAHGDGRISRGRTGRGGGFAFRQMPDGVYDLVALHPDGLRGEARGIATGTSCQVVLGPAATLRLTYVGELEGATVLVLRGGSPVGFAEITPGTSEVVSVPTGALRLEQISPGDLTPLWSRTVTTALGEELEIVFP
jgi:hypothetical protein